MSVLGLIRGFQLGEYISVTISAFRASASVILSIMIYLLVFSSNLNGNTNLKVIVPPITKRKNLVIPA